MATEFSVGDRIVSGDVVHVLDQAQAAALNAGGRIVALTDQISIIDHDIVSRVAEGVGRAVTAFGDMANVSDDSISRFFELFAVRLEDDGVFAQVLEANAADVESARSRNRSTGRLEITSKMRTDMIDGARMWSRSSVSKELVTERVDHEGWSVEKVASPLGVVAFVFEGRPNVCVDATGVLRTGNTCVFRIGSDALRTANALMVNCLTPSLVEAGLPADAVVLLDESDRAAGLALFSDRRLGLAVARGSGRAVQDLGFVAQSSGIATSLHGTGGAWMILGDSVDSGWFAETVVNSLDRKVCNTVNVCCVPHGRVAEVVGVLAQRVADLGRRSNARCVIHTIGLDQREIGTLAGEFIDVVESTVDELGTEWEWDVSPEFFVVATSSVDEAFDLCNRYSPNFVVSMLSNDPEDHHKAWRMLNAPFVGNGFTRWVDGQYALGRPELGLSNWQHGRALARGGILSGDDIRTYRYRMVQHDPHVRR